MKTCLILEGSYPYISGGVSSWMHNYIKAMPEQEFVLWLIGASDDIRNQFCYDIPANVVEIHQIFLEDALKISSARKKRISFTTQESKAVCELMTFREPDWDSIFRIFQDRKVNPVSFLMSKEFLDNIDYLCRTEYKNTAYAPCFYNMRSMLLPLLYLIRQDIPHADVYHATCAGYAGLLGALGTWKHHRPLVLTEHGIYTREREGELLRAKWVETPFRKTWIRLFYMLSHLTYDSASCVTSLFPRALETQVELGCPREKCRVISNGIHLDEYLDIPRKKENGFIDIGAIVRIAKIKDIKTMLYAFYELNTRLPKTRLHIMGGVNDQEYMNECIELLQELEIKNVLFTGVVDVRKYMEKLDFTILTSISEGQPLSVIESFAAGLPCVTTDVGCCRELIEDFSDGLGSAGICVPPIHWMELADAMEYICRNEETRLQMGAVGRARAKKLFQHKTMIQKYLDVYYEVT